MLKVAKDWLCKTKTEIVRTKKGRLKRLLRVARDCEDREAYPELDERRLKAIIVLLEYQTGTKKTAKKEENAG